MCARASVRAPRAVVLLAPCGGLFGVLVCALLRRRWMSTKEDTRALSVAPTCHATRWPDSTRRTRVRTRRAPGATRVRTRRAGARDRARAAFDAASPSGGSPREVPRDSEPGAQERLRALAHGRPCARARLRYVRSRVPRRPRSAHTLAGRLPPLSISHAPLAVAPAPPRGHAGSGGSLRCSH